MHMRQTTKRRRGAAALLGAALLLGLCGCRDGAPQSYTTVHPDRGDIENRVEDTATVAYRDPTTVLPVVSGKLLSCTFEEGDAVEAGQVLYVIDSGDLEDQITQSQLSLRAAQAAAAQAAAACEDLSIRAAASGAVAAVHVHVGDYVTVGTPVAQLVDNVDLTLTVPFARADAAAIQPGAAASVSFAAMGETVTGTVTRVYDSATVLSGGRECVNVELAFQNPGALTRDMSATASVGGVACMESGPVCYATEQAVYAAQNGQVLTLPVQEGDRIAAGEVVATLKNESLTNAAVNAQLSAETAAVNLELLKAKREDYTITAPADALVLTRSAKAGDYAAAATPLATLAEGDSMCVNAQIDEIYIERIWPGQEAQVTFTDDAGTQRTYAAQVRRVDESGVTSGGVTDYGVELTLEDTQGLKAGMNVSVSILTQRKADCLRVPSQAVSGGTVQVLRDGKAVEVEVVCGVSGGGYTEILSGLTPDDTAILP